ncbi:hypothetical protein QZH41_019939 [Actinostola sp. cb2023]|nr:hypothetical protein QZH41_019939 [Actinostola sp. cb2023]
MLLKTKGDSNMAGQQVLVRKYFLWGIASVYLFAFSSLYIQIPGLYGRNGLMPAKLALKEEYATTWDNFINKPTLLWFMPHLGLDIETGMELLCLVGMLISLLALSMETWRDSVTFSILWYLYYSLYQNFYQLNSKFSIEVLNGPCKKLVRHSSGFSVIHLFIFLHIRDILLMETGFLAVLVAPLRLFVSRHEKSVSRHHDGITLWLVKWLAFRLLFCSGVVKLNSQCPTWWGLTALDWHYESQCIPTPLAWFAHQLPSWLQRLSIALVYTILIVLSWLFFAPVRSLRIVSFYSQLFFQVLIILTGNYNFFNLLAVISLLPVLDDEHLKAVLPASLAPKDAVIVHKFSPPTWIERIKRLMSKVTFIGVIGYVVYWMVKLFDLQLSSKHVIKSKIMSQSVSTVAFSKDQFFDAVEKYTPISIWIGLGSLCIEILRAFVGCIMERGIMSKLWCILQWCIFSFAAIGMFAISLVPYTDIDYSTQQKVWPVIKRMEAKVHYLELVNAYGLFRSMTGVGGRPEVNIEGSYSLEGPWKEYSFLYKPVKLNTPLPFVAPHQPRLDWQMWFAALGSYQHNPWFVHLIYRLLHSQQEVLDLMDSNPFPARPPEYIRANLYKYHYTRLHKNTTNIFEAVHNSRLIKNWWKRELTSEYLPVLEKADPTLIAWLNHFGYAKSGPWPEHPSGWLYRLIKYLRSAVRTMDPVAFILVLFVCGLIMGWANHNT